MKECTYGHYLRRARKRANITQERLAELTSCAVSTISRIEAGEENPRARTFYAVDDVLGSYGLEYGEHTLDILSEGRRVRNELLEAIHIGQLEKIENVLEKFQHLMDMNNKKHLQYYMFSHLETARRRGMPIEEFIEASVAIYQSVKSFPGYDEIADLQLRKIEYTILMKIAIAYIEIEETVLAKHIIHGLIRNPMNSNSCFRRDRFLYLTHQLAKLNMVESNYAETVNLLEEVFSDLLNDGRYRMLYLNLLVQQEICIRCGDTEGEMLLDSFFLSSKRLMEYMFRKYKRP
ncbi:MAG: helix-turn-helix domain-containing protein [Pseudobutyrivibrio sp.]|nr:helix-turn-helix domain-containing protein [Pseudobutyrivibrio sp.]